MQPSDCAWQVKKLKMNCNETVENAGRKDIFLYFSAFVRSGLLRLFEHIRDCSLSRESTNGFPVYHSWSESIEIHGTSRFRGKFAFCTVSVVVVSYREK